MLLTLRGIAMARNKYKSKRRSTGEPHARNTQDPASIDVQPNRTEQHSKVRTGLRRFAQSLKRASILLSIIGIVALLLGFALDVDDAVSRWLSRKRPAAEIMYFRKQGSSYSLIEPENVVIQPLKKELEKGYVAVPINLAVRNEEKGRLEATRVEITYPKSLRVIPQGRPKIDPQNNTLIYEHDLRSLDPVTSFTPLDTIDVIYIRYAVKGLKTTVFLHNNVFGFAASAGVEVTNRPFGVDLQVKLFSRGRPPLETKLHVGVDTSNAMSTFGNSANEYVPGLLTNSDVALFRAVSKRLSTAKRLWEVKVRGKPVALALAKTRYGRGFYNGLLLGGKVTEVYADTNGDGLLDYLLWDSSAPKSPNQKWLPSQPEPLMDMERPDEVEVA
jgi:hypothetical protein